MSENLELKEKFFVQYWGQKILKITSSKFEEVGSQWNLKHPSFKLLLRPLSALSDNHAIEYFDILWHESHKSKSKEFKIEYGKEWANNLLSERFGLIPSNILNGIDYLRSKGYTLPFMQYSVEDLVNLGWIELYS